MPITKSAIKRMRSDKCKQEQNMSVRSRLRTLFKAFTKVLEAKDTAKATAQARQLVKEYDTAASKGIIPKERANRKKARIALALRKLTAA